MRLTMCSAWRPHFTGAGEQRTHPTVLTCQGCGGGSFARVLIEQCPQVSIPHMVGPCLMGIVGVIPSPNPLVVYEYVLADNSCCWRCFYTALCIHWDRFPMDTLVSSCGITFPL